jgi:hypothetical protein
MMILLSKRTSEGVPSLGSGDCWQFYTDVCAGKDGKGLNVDGAYACGGKPP